MMRAPRYGFMLVLAVAAAPGRGHAQDRPVFRLDDWSYTLRDILGTSEADLRKRFDAEMRGASEDDLRAYLSPANLAGLDRVPPEGRRRSLEDRVHRKNRGLAIRPAAETIVLAGIATRIVQEHGLDPAEYFDLEGLRTAIRKQTQCVRLAYTDIDKVDRDVPLHEQLIQDGVKQDKAAWQQSRKVIRDLSPVQRWHADFRLKSALYEEVALRAAIASGLVHQASKRGWYYETARALTLVDRSLVVRYTIDGYSGDHRALDEFAGVLVKDGVVREDVAPRLDALLRQVSPAATVRVTIGSGTEVANRLVRPAIGRCVELKPGSYEILGYVRRVTEEEVTKGDRSAYDLHVHIVAHLLLARDYMPALDVLEPDLPLDHGYLAVQLRSDGVSRVAGGTREGDYVKKPYPAEPFDQVRAVRPVLQSLSVRVAAAVASGDPRGAERVAEEIAAARKATPFGPAAGRFDVLRDELARAFPPAKDKAP